MRRKRTVLHLAVAFGVGGCAGHMPIGPHFERPPQLVGEWIDVRHTSLGDTALWVLRQNGYDGSAHILAKTRSEKRYGEWYFTGPLDDTTHRALCFSKRLGRNGPTCLAFAIDTTTIEGSRRRRLTIHGYQGEHFTGDRVLLAHGP